ncbi:MAG: thioredoxin family protein [Verrucomicrobia bacterium]|nr:thioredoxin family protein [Verrucomicrobiota bacterium]
MNPHIRRRLAGIALSLAVVAWSGAAESAVPFRSVSFEAATQAAAKEGKLVFIDFYTTWCEPCKRLDALTWTDAEVGRLVGEKAVALKLDAEKEGKDLAKRYKIAAYPTLLLLKADGTEVDRIVGFSEPAKFIPNFTASVAGKTTLTRAIEAAAAVPAGGKEEVQAHYDLGRTLARNGREADALVEYLWCYDDGMLQVASFSGVRNSSLLSSIADLGRKYPPALEALSARRDQAEAAMMADAADRRAPMDFASLNGALKDNARTLAVFDQLPTNDRRRDVLLVRVYDLLIKDRRYDDAAKARPLEKIEQAFDQNLTMMARMASNPRPAGMADPFPQYVVQTTVKNIEVLIGSGQIAAAQSLGKRLLDKVDGSDAARKQLAEAAARAGHPEVFAEPAGKL